MLRSPLVRGSLFLLALLAFLASLLYRSAKQRTGDLAPSHAPAETISQDKAQ